MQNITPCLWFDGQAEEAAQFYVSVVKNSKITSIVRYGETGNQALGRPADQALIVAFELNGQPFTALNGGPEFKFSEAISLQLMCDNQEEVDFYWEELSEDGEKGQCSWLKDKYGVSWQIVPTAFMEMLQDSDGAKSGRVFAAMMQMTKLDIATLQRAFNGP